jgi:hypothetical protein
MYQAIALRSALSAWNRAHARFVERFPLAKVNGSRLCSAEYPIPLENSALALGCEWQASALRAGLGVVARPYSVGEGG